MNTATTPTTPTDPQPEAGEDVFAHVRRLEHRIGQLEEELEATRASLYGDLWDKVDRVSMLLSVVGGVFSVGLRPDDEEERAA